MRTPIVDFINEYRERHTMRLHMPGHKGQGELEACDITEISGADSLYEAQGIIRESELYASELFGAHTFYSAEGSSLCIRAMLYLVTLYAHSKGMRPAVLAGRNAHKTFHNAAVLLDIEVSWLYPTDDDGYLSCTVDPVSLDERLSREEARPTALYVTSPDYLGHLQDVRAIAEVCHAHGVLLLVDNAHGAYLKFLRDARHPMDLGADLCCDSAHKTLPVLTGGAYLHVAKGAPSLFSEHAKEALALFGSTSPSYLILSSLDAVNRYLADGYAERLAAFVAQLDSVKARLAAHGYRLCSDEPLKLTLLTRSYGYTGVQVAEHLERSGIVCEFCDPDAIVLMLTPAITDAQLDALCEALFSLPRTAPLGAPPSLSAVPRAMSMRDARLSASELLPIEACLGRVLAASTVGCPPAVPILVSGEVVTPSALSVLRYYGIDRLRVVCEV